MLVSPIAPLRLCTQTAGNYVCFSLMVMASFAPFCKTRVPWVQCLTIRCFCPLKNDLPDFGRVYSSSLLKTFNREDGKNGTHPLLHGASTVEFNSIAPVTEKLTRFTTTKLIAHTKLKRASIQPCAINGVQALNVQSRCVLCADGKERHAVSTYGYFFQMSVSDITIRWFPMFLVEHWKARFSVETS